MEKNMILETNKIYCGDNLEIIKRLDDCTIDLTVTSPPYDNLREYNGYSWNFEALAQQLYRVTKEGDVVLDMFMGSGTTAIACINTNRNYIGFELDKHYCDIANERIQKALAEKEVSE